MEVLRTTGIGCVLSAVCAAASAQSPPAAASPASAASAAAPAPTTLERVEVTGVQAGDTEQRRSSTAAMIVVGRDEIERFGDTSLGEIFKRLPGVTVQGAPGRRGAVRMRGLGSEYTQILLDGERMPAAFSLDSLAPEQIERIEILRAPTAETGARAIAGTINVITRQGSAKPATELRVGLGVENGQLQPRLTWTHNDNAGGLRYNASLTVFDEPRDSDRVTTLTDQRLADGVTTLDQSEATQLHDRRRGLNLSSRLQWRDADGDGLTVTPQLSASEERSRRDATLHQSVGSTPALYDHAASDGVSREHQLRLGSQWRRSLADDTRLELRGSLRLARESGHVLRNEFDAAGGTARTFDERTDARERRYSVGGKLTKQWEEEHSAVAGLEAETARRNDAASSTQDGAPLLADFGANLQATTTRFAAYVQDDWTVSAQWAVQAGLRWEGIATRGAAGSGSTEVSRSSVWSPLLHAVWKPDPAGRDQLRISLTRSYRAPSLQNLIARPMLSTRFPAPGANVPAAPDRVGNPALKPELATGIDLAFEHYLPAGGLLSANLFHRRIANLMRNVTTLETVAWASVPRWVSRPNNVGTAITQGLELEARLRASDVWAEAVPVNLRANLSFYRSRVDGVPGPDNRLDQQPSATANLGADHRLRSMPLTLGGNLNWNPAYTTRISEPQSAFQGRKVGLDAYALWTFSPALRLRVSAGNLARLDYVTAESFDAEGVRETSRTTARSYLNWQIRLELKL